jgi:hypothetical protein
MKKMERLPLPVPLDKRDLPPEIIKKVLEIALKKIREKKQLAKKQKSENENG